MRDEIRKEAGIRSLLFSFSGPLKGVKRDSSCTPPCLQGVVCYTQTDTERKSKENSLPVDDCFRDDFQGCWGDMSAPVFGALIDTTELRWKIGRRLLRAIFHKERPSVSVGCTNPHEPQDVTHGYPLNY